ncbi:uncharacterized protein LOC123525366 [Mercenaria mercenaria]|uniref:uncharacterized protein LOC123525366 n=1 Tax=Mercenaria mercenaria TaxID=6596 RepID=UPI00234ECF50|nr:uncharacterized protein LOC123525366 [Mercenaria mercenaria]
MPQLPYIPDTFQLRVEANIIDKQTTWSAEEYYDDNNNRAALRLLRNNSMDYMIFDYTNNQIIYDVNGNCSVTTLNRDPYGNQDIFGMKASGGGGGIPHIYTTSSALHFAKSNGLMYKGTKIVRGINCDWWQSCMYWPNLAANFTLDYYFSAYNWTAPDLSNQVPVLAEIQGVTLGAIPFHHTYEYFDYRSHIWDSDSVFDTPQGKVCSGRKQTRKVPVLSGQYSYREEIVDTMNLAVSQADVYYDYTYNLVRFDYRPPYSRYPYYATNPVSEIHDYSTGIAYAIDTFLGNCTMIPIQNTTFDASVKISVNANQSQQFYVHMKSPSQLFYLDNTTYTYEGTRVVRGILCDVFISNRTDFHLPNYNNFASTFEFYFMNSQWTASTSLGAKSKTNSNIPVQLRISTPDWVGYQATYNVYNFDSEDPSYNRFQVSGCYDDFSKKAFIMEFPGTWDNSLLQYQNQFIRQITNRITSVSHVSHIRVQNPQFRVESNEFYFVATLLELPPPIAYFRQIPGRFRQFTNDKSITVSSAADCARACNDPGTLGQCNSFDYCAYQNLCGLSKSHTEDGSVVVNSNGQCDHYVRTSQSANVELSLADAWKNLKNDVLIGNFQFSVTINGQPSKFKAGSIDDNVIQNAQRTMTTQSLMAQFNTQINKGLNGYDDADLTGIAIDDCASACLTQQSWVCNSFSYCFDTGYCSLSKLHPDERPTAVVNHQLCDLYTKKYTADYQMFKGTTVLSGSDTIYQNIYSADECGKLCTNYNGFNCKSFDYCDDISTCYLGRTHYFDVPQADKLDSPMCNHYSRKYLADFKITTRQHLTNKGDRIISGVPVDQCAKLCVEEENNNCASFGYCGNTTECRLSTASMRNIGQVSSEPNLWCDVYNRQTFPDGTPFINNPSKYYSLPSSSGKYTGGAMAGLAFGMLIVGILLAAGVYFGIAKFRGKPLDGMAVSFVKQEGD